MKSVSLFVLALALNASPDVKDRLNDVPQIETFALRVMASTVPGLETRTAAAGMLAAVESARKPAAGHEAGWRRGFADGRARVYNGAHPQTAAEAEDPYHRGYEAGWAAGAQLSGY